MADRGGEHVAGGFGVLALDAVASLTGPVQTVAAVPLPDGRVPARFRQPDRTVRLWEVVEEEEAVPRVPGHLADVIARSCDLLDRTRDATAIADLLRARSA